LSVIQTKASSNELRDTEQGAKSSEEERISKTICQKTDGKKSLTNRLTSIIVDGIFSMISEVDL
jgi:hypothetical protein